MVPFWVFVVSVYVNQTAITEVWSLSESLLCPSVYVNQTAITEVWSLSESLLCLSVCLSVYVNQLSSRYGPTFLLVVFPCLCCVRLFLPSQTAITAVWPTLLLAIFLSLITLCCVRLFLSTKEPSPRYGPLFLFWRSLSVSVSVLFVYLPVMFVYI